jgi:hypothetical protein
MPCDSSGGGWDALRAGISRAFEGVPFPGAENLLNDLCYDDAELVDFATMCGEQTWQDVASEIVGRNYSALGFFSPRAFQFFIPAYMTVGFEYQHAQDLRSNVLPRVVGCFAALDWERARGVVHRQFGALNQVQRAIVVEYLQFVAVSAPEESADAATALRCIAGLESP